MKYTELELKIIAIIGNFLNYETLEANLQDNATYFDIDDVKQLTGMATKEARGVVSSLIKKNILVLDTTDHPIFWVTPDGLREYFEKFNNPETNKEEESMIRAIEKATGVKYKVKEIEGGFEVYTLEGEKYKKLKESTFKRYYKIVKAEEKATETVDEPITDADFDEPEPKAEPKKEKKEHKEKKETKKEKQVKESEPVVELNEEDREGMVAKIRKILNLSKNNPSVEEGMAAALQAQKLMAKYRINEDEVTLEKIEDDIVSLYTNQKHNAHLRGWRKTLATIIAKNFRCNAYMDGKDIVFRGFKTDAEVALDTYNYLYSIGNRLASKKRREEKAEKGSGKGAHASFIYGYLQGIEESLGEQCTALMLIIPKKVADEYEEFKAANLETKKTVAKFSKNKNFEEGLSEGKAVVKSRQLDDKKSGKSKGGK